jgi:hypothetical protein
LPFNSKLMPAAFPALTTTSPLARTEVCAGAIRVSWAMGLPSAVIETQLVSSARINTLKVLGGVTVAAFSTVVGLAADAFAWAGAALVADSDEIVPVGSFPDDEVLAGDIFPAFSGAAARGGWFGCDADALTGPVAGV